MKGIMVNAFVVLCTMEEITRDSVGLGPTRNMEIPMSIR